MLRCEMVILLVILASMPLLTLQKDVSTNIVVGSNCEKLDNPGNGKFHCNHVPDRQTCVLVCNAGFVLPITEYKKDGQHIPIKDRGVYHCVKTAGGLIWMPNLFFDCVEEVFPGNFLYYFELTLSPADHPCTNNSEKERHLNQIKPNTNASHTYPECLNVIKELCYWTYDMTCVGGAWKTDAWLRVPFSMSVLNDYDSWSESLIEKMRKDCREFLTLQTQKDPSVINSEGLSLECPKGTRLEEDYTCRGCSKGHYMAHDLMECLPCPGNKYQDENYATSCKPCLQGSHRDRTGLKNIVECFHFSKWEEDAGVVTMLACLGCIVIVATVLLGYRSQVVNEPDGHHQETYEEPVVVAYGGGKLQRIMRKITSLPGTFIEVNSMNVSISTNDLEKVLIDEVHTEKEVQEFETRISFESLKDDANNNASWKPHIGTATERGGKGKKQQ